MKVAFVEQEAELGGVEYTTLYMAQALDKLEFEPVVICPEDGDLPRLARQGGLTVRVVPRPRFSSVSLIWGRRYFANPLGFVITTVNVFRAMNALYRYFQKNPPDIVITKGLLAHFYGGIAAHRLRIPCIWHIQEEVDKKRAMGLFRYILVKLAEKIPSKIIVDAEALIEQFSSVPALQVLIEVIYNGIDTQQFVPFSKHDKQEAKNKFNIPANAIVIGQVGRIIPLKGQTTLLQSFAQLAQEFPDVHLLFVGAPLFGSRDYEEKLRSQAARCGLTKRVHFSGFVPDVRYGLAAMDIFVHASIETDSPLSIMEAMSCGLPVVVSGVRGTVEMVNAEVDALVFEPGDSESLGLMLSKLLRSRQLQNELGSHARAAVIKRFSLQVSVVQLERLIRKVYAA